jgi:hypothetical protein
MIHDGHSQVLITGDLSHCFACGRTWDTNDGYPPPCVESPPMIGTTKRHWMIYAGVWLVVLVGIIGLWLVR